MSVVYQNVTQGESGAVLGQFVPESVIRQGILSPTSEALHCFSYQLFSQKLQIYMINYNIAVNSYYPIYG